MRKHTGKTSVPQDTMMLPEKNADLVQHSGDYNDDVNCLLLNFKATSEETHEEVCAKEIFAAVFISKAQVGPGRKHLQCSKSHCAAANKHTVKIRVSHCNITHHITAGNDKALNHLHTVRCVCALSLCLPPVCLCMHATERRAAIVT